VTATAPWGDVDDLLALLDVQPTGDGRWVGAVHPPSERPVVEGSQLLGEAIVAAGRAAPGRRAVAASMCFTRVADALEPVLIELDQVTSGRTFTAFVARAVQGDRVCAVGTLLLDVTAPDVVRHAVAPPAVPGPDGAEPYDMGVVGRELRIVDGAYTGDPDAPVGPPVLDAWVRFPPLPDDPCLHAGVLAQLTGHLSIAAALRPHAGVGEAQAHRTLSTAVNAISLSLHADVRVDQWLLYHHESTFAGDGMTHAECRVHTEGGALVASFTVDAMVRAFADPNAPVDDRTAL
jgi:acyl-CoA thioesterase-2